MALDLLISRVKCLGKPPRLFVSASKNTREKAVLLENPLVDEIAVGETCGAGFRGCKELNNSATEKENKSPIWVGCLSIAFPLRRMFFDRR